MNPYHVLRIHQDASKTEIIKAFASARLMNAKTKEFTPQELVLAQKALLNPAKRLAADFLLPQKQVLKRPRLLPVPELASSPADIESINNPFDTLQRDLAKWLNPST